MDTLRCVALPDTMINALLRFRKVERGRQIQGLGRTYVAKQIYFVPISSYLQTPITVLSTYYLEIHTLLYE